MHDVEVVMAAGELSENVQLDVGSLDGNTFSVVIALRNPPDEDTAERVKREIDAHSLQLAAFRPEAPGTAVQQLARGDQVAVATAR